MRQKNMLQMKEQDKSIEKELSKMVKNNKRIEEFKVMVIKNANNT